jgi:pantothenate kinase
MVPTLIADSHVVMQLAARLVRCAAADPKRRYLVGIAGIGASGKSTLAGRVCEAVERLRPGIVRLVPMDGFHLTNAQLDAVGLRDRKGSPATFDAEGYLHLLEASRSATKQLTFPVYDRTVHEPVVRDTSTQTLGPTTRLVVTEGNYLLLDEQPWSRLEHVLDECWWLDTPPDVARQWMIERHIRGGRDESAAVSHYERSDRLNVAHVLSHRREPDITLRWP